MAFLRHLTCGVTPRTCRTVAFVANSSWDPAQVPRTRLLQLNPRVSIPLSRHIRVVHPVLRYGQAVQARSSNEKGPDSGVPETDDSLPNLKPAQTPDQSSPRDAPDPAENAATPTPRDALSWFCIAIILLISLTDFTPLGSALQSASNTSASTPTSSSSAPWILALVQWLFFVAPTISWAKDCRFPIQETFKLKPCCATDLGMGALGGVACWGLVAALLSLKNGSMAAPLESSAYASAFNLGSPADYLWYAASPAAAEEILFRGFVLSALCSSIGRIDSIMLAAAMFGGFHLSVSQLFPTMVLGIAAGFVTLATGSVFPAIALHFANNAAAIMFGGVGPLSS